MPRVLPAKLFEIALAYRPCTHGVPLSPPAAIARFVATSSTTAAVRVLNLTARIFSLAFDVSDDGAMMGRSFVLYPTRCHISGRAGDGVTNA
jgi:hypothetical protein